MSKDIPAEAPGEERRQSRRAEDRVAEAAACAAIEKLLVRFGVDTSDPIEAQADFQWLRNARRGSEEMHKYAKRTVITTIILGTLWAVVEGIKTYLRMSPQ